MQTTPDKQVLREEEWRMTMPTHTSSTPKTTWFTASFQVASVTIQSLIRVMHLHTHKSVPIYFNPQYIWLFEHVTFDLIGF